jgi:hypothetical protein
LITGVRSWSLFQKVAEDFHIGHNAKVTRWHAVPQSA